MWDFMSDRKFTGASRSTFIHSIQHVFIQPEGVLTLGRNTEVHTQDQVWPRLWTGL